MSSYPKWLYHPGKAPVVVEDEAAHKALGAGWVETPAIAVKAPEPTKAPEPLGGLLPPAPLEESSAEKYGKKVK